MGGGRSEKDHGGGRGCWSINDQLMMAVGIMGHDHKWVAIVAGEMNQSNELVAFDWIRIEWECRIMGLRETAQRIIPQSRAWILVIGSDLWRPTALSGPLTFVAF